MKDPKSALLPDIVNVREVSIIVAKAVIKQAVKEGLSQEPEIPEDDTVLEDWIREQMWDARYRKLVKVDIDDASAHAKGEAGPAGTR
jgi:malate dehydrogenase (oxaloacetate-decarboxylating)